MNRLKLWAFALLVLAAGGSNLHLVTQWLTHRAVAEADRALQAAAAQLDARSQLLAAQASALAEAAARAPSVLAALSEGGDGDPAAAAAVAVVGAARGMPAEHARGLLVGAAGPEGAVLKAGGRRLELEDPAGGPFAEPLRGARREGYARAGGSLWFLAAVPAARGAVAVGLPVDLPWAQALRAAAGAEVTLAAGHEPPLTTLGRGDLAAVAAASRAPQPRPVDAGALPRLRTAIPWLPPVPLLLVRAPGHRVQVVALRGMKAGVVALSLPLAPVLEGVATYQVVSVAVLLLLLLAGLFLGLLVTSEPPAAVPRELVQAADRIQRGDFAARVVPLAGSMGTVASALNRAAEAAEEGRARPAAPSPDPIAPPGPLPGTDPFAAPPPGLLPLDITQRTETTGPDLFAPQEAPEPAPAPSHAFSPLDDSISGATSLSTRPEDLLSSPGGEPPVRPAPPAPLAPAARVAPPRQPTPVPAPAGEPDAEHWESVFQEFLRIRAACGESTDGLTFERFQAKLRSNRAALIQKHDCRAVRFQVYVKEGRAALRATPVR